MSAQSVQEFCWICESKGLDLAPVDLVMAYATRKVRVNNPICSECMDYLNELPNSGEIQYWSPIARQRLSEVVALENKDN